VFALFLATAVFALFLATAMQNVLELMLYSYAFMVSGLFVPVLAAFYTKNPSKVAAFLAMLLGGSTTLLLIISNRPLPLSLDPNIFGISMSAVTYLLF